MWTYFIPGCDGRGLDLDLRVRLEIWDLDLDPSGSWIWIWIRLEIWDFSKPHVRCGNLKMGPGHISDFSNVNKQPRDVLSRKMRNAVYMFMGWMLRFGRNGPAKWTPPSCLSTLGGAIGFQWLGSIF